MKRLVLLMVLILAVSASLAGATTLTHRNSSVNIDDTNARSTTFTIDGVNHLLSQKWFYRINGGNVLSLDTINSTPVRDPLIPNRKVSYTYTNADVEIIFDYTLMGGLPFSYTADLGEGFSFNNLSNTAMVVDLFQYTNWDLTNSKLDDGIKIVIDDHNGGIVTQWDSNTVAREAVTPGVAHYQASRYSDLIDALTGTYNLNDTTINGVLDYEFAWQWHETVAARDSFIISKDKHIVSSVPEASTLVGFGSAMAIAGSGIIGRLRRRRF